MQKTLFDSSAAETLQDRMGYLTLNFSIQDIAEMDERKGVAPELDGGGCEDASR